jgi:hypothetical protein
VYERGAWIGSGWTGGIAFGVKRTRPSFSYTIASYNIDTGEFTGPKGSAAAVVARGGLQCVWSWIC